MSGVLQVDPRNALSFSNFGDAGQTFGGNFPALSILYGDRYADMDRRQAYYDCTQHDSKMYDFDGRLYNPRSMNPLLSSEKSTFYVPLKMRRPSAPYRLGKIIVDSFTNLLFGENRFPNVRVDGDKQTEDFQQTIARVGRLPLKMIKARTLGGGMGTVGMSWCIQNGKPRFEVHNAKTLHVHSWEDRLNFIPRHISEVYLFYKVQWDGKQFSKVYYWFRRDWTPNADIVFKDVPYDRTRPPYWVPDMEKTTIHNDNLNHFVWIQNLPSEQIDGLPDYEGLYDNFDVLDILNSVVVRGSTLNLDPTLVLKLDPDLVNRMGVRKGSDNALVVGKDGDAMYLELNGQGISAGKDLIEMLRRAILETAQCIVPDPHEVAAQGVSSVAVKTMFAPMLSKADVLREQYGAAIERLLEGPTTIARAKMGTRVFVSDQQGTQLTHEDGTPMEGEFVMNLPPKIEQAPPKDPATGLTIVDPATGTPLPDQPVRIPRVPGQGGELNLRWPPYFPPTPDDQAKIVANMQIATGGKAFLSKRTAVEITATAFGIDPAEEQERIDTQGVADKADAAAMTPPGMGGEVDAEDQHPDDAGGDGGAPPPKKPFGGGHGFHGR